MRFILGANAILSEFSAHVTWPGNKEMGLHIDQWFMPHPVDPNEHYPRPSDVSRTEQKRGDPVTARHPVNPPVVCNVMFAITDFTVENGATRLVPGSHRSGVHPAPNQDYERLPCRGSRRQLRGLGGPDLARGEPQHGEFAACRDHDLLGPRPTPSRCPMPWNSGH